MFRLNAWNARQARWVAFMWRPALQTQHNLTTYVGMCQKMTSPLPQVDFSPKNTQMPNSHLRPHVFGRGVAAGLWLLVPEPGAPGPHARSTAEEARGGTMDLSQGVSQNLSCSVAPCSPLFFGPLKMAFAKKCFFFLPPGSLNN